VLVANSLMTAFVNGQRVDDDSLAGMTNGAILDFPTAVNEMRDHSQLYDISDAYNILTATDSCRAMDFDYKIFAQAAKKKTEATDDLRVALVSLMASDEPFVCIYVSPPLTMLICCHSASELSVVDTHAVPKKFGGYNKHAVIVTAVNNINAITAVSDWLIMRVCKQGQVTQELAVVTPLSAEAALADTSSAALAHTLPVGPRPMDTDDTGRQPILQPNDCEQQPQPDMSDSMAILTPVIDLSCHRHTSSVHNRKLQGVLPELQTDATRTVVVSQPQIIRHASQQQLLTATPAVGVADHSGLPCNVQSRGQGHRVLSESVSLSVVVTEGVRAFTLQWSDDSRGTDVRMPMSGNRTSQSISTSVHCPPPRPSMCSPVAADVRSRYTPTVLLKRCTATDMAKSARNVSSIGTKEICCPKCHLSSVQNHQFRPKFRPNFEFSSKCS